eukprot:TRINITY_DN10531_c0_g2_i8.p1 TRINITY_DN10531_c0_g2~~TRINITY_DN10531_c0_g2_i8.p1  ORF type:complete len:228 (-),score=31.56 TRINITY_DN10531_c0_g2_i8:119-802(-)
MHREINQAIVSAAMPDDAFPARRKPGLTLQLNADAAPVQQPLLQMHTPGASWPSSPVTAAAGDAAFVTPVNAASTAWRATTCPYAPVKRKPRAHLASSCSASTPMSVAGTPMSLGTPVNYWPTPKSSPMAAASPRGFAVTPKATTFRAGGYYLTAPLQAPPTTYTVVSNQPTFFPTTPPATARPSPSVKRRGGDALDDSGMKHSPPGQRLLSRSRTDVVKSCDYEYH